VDKKINSYTVSAKHAGKQLGSPTVDTKEENTKTEFTQGVNLTTGVISFGTETSREFL
jgi:hypothetical protein